jgi:hypothetical protein
VRLSINFSEKTGIFEKRTAKTLRKQGKSRFAQLKGL